MVTLLIYSDGKSIKTQTFADYSSAYAEMKKQYASALKDCPADNLSCIINRNTAGINRKDTNMCWSIKKVSMFSPLNRIGELALENGIITVDKSLDPDYPGLDIEYVPDNCDPNNLSNPRVLMEQPENKNLRVLVWADPKSEDYSDSFDFLQTVSPEITEKD